MLYRRPRVSVLAAVVQTQTANIQVRRFASQDLSPGFLSVKNVQFVIKLKSIFHCNGHIISMYKKNKKRISFSNSRRLIEDKYFETVVLALILLSSFVMTLEDVW